MKTFTATHLNKHAQEVFAAAKDDGSVMIKHDRYDGGFRIVYNVPITFEEVKFVADIMSDSIDGNEVTE